MIQKIWRHINQFGIIDICRKILPNNSKIRILFMCTQQTYQDISYILAHNPIINALLRIQIRQSMFSGDNAIKLKNSNRKISGNSQCIWKLKNTTHESRRNSRVKEEIKRKIRKYFDLNDKKCQKLWHAMETVSRDKLRALNVNMRKKN